MKYSINRLFPKTSFSLTIITFLAIVISGCKSDKKQEENLMSEMKNVSVIEIITNVMDFQTVDTIHSGWNTFKYINKSEEAHFILFDKYPEGKTIVDTYKEITPPFDKGLELINQGKMDEAMAAFGELPEWFSQIVFSGGSGMISPGETNTFTLKLDPGLYIIECYVKMNNGMFHASMGMTKEIFVKAEDGGKQPPEATVNLSISSTEGIVFNDSIPGGSQIIRVDYIDQIVHENFLGHDINLVKLGDNVDMNALEAWMNWATPTGLMTPSPEGVTFLGGTNDAPAGSVQYFQVDLAPGNYAFISEVPNASQKGMLKTFTIQE